MTTYFGGCPACAGNDGFLNVERNHFMVCHAHRVRWWIGSNLFSGWRDEDPEGWKTNAALLATYRAVEPLPEALA